MYASRIEESEKRYRKEHPLHLRRRQADEDGLDLEDDEYMRKVDNGLFTLQWVAFLIGFVATAGEIKLRERVLQLLNQHDSDLSSVKQVLTVFETNVGDEKKEEDTEGEKHDVKLKEVLQAILGMLE